MSCKELFDHLFKDLDKIQYRINYYRPKAIKEFKKTIAFPAWIMYDYTIPNNNNNYVIFYYAKSRDEILNPEASYFCTTFNNNQRLIIRTIVGGYKHTPNTPTKAIRTIHIFTSHFLQRYRERFLKDSKLTSNETACRFFSRNLYLMPIDINEEINKHISKYGEGANKGYRVNDGICFTRSFLEGEFYGDDLQDKDRVDALVAVFTTFMVESDMHENQRSAIFKEHWKKWTEAYTDFIKESKNGELHLKLDR